MSVTWFDSVAITVEIAFAANPLDLYLLDEFGELVLDEDENPIEIEWTDVSAYVHEIPSISSGRSSEFSQIAPSTLSVVLMNGDRRFDPEYSSGPYYGDLLPMKKIRVKVVYSAVTYYLFTGYVQGWPQEYQGVVDSTVTIDCVDGSRFLEQAILARSAYEAAVLADAPAHYWPLQERNVSSASDYVDVVGGLILSQTGQWGAGPVNTKMPDVNASIMPTVAQTLAAAGEAFLRTATLPTVAPLSLEAWMYVGTQPDADLYGLSWRVTGAAAGDGVYVGVDATSGLWSVGFSSVSLNKYKGFTESAVLATPGWHHVVVTGSSATVLLYVDGVEVFSTSTSAGTSAIYSVFATARIDENYTPDALAHIASYPTALSAARVAEHYLAGITAYGHPTGERSGARVDRVLDEIGWPSADRDISTGDTVHGPYLPSSQSAMAYLRDVETAEDGYLFLDGQGRVAFRDRNWQWTQTVSAAFSDTPAGAELDYVDILIDANTVAAIRSSVSASYGTDGYLFSEDATSLAAYGPARESLSVPTIDSPTTARGLTAYKLRTMKDPQTRITDLTHTPRILTSVAFPKVFGLQTGSRVTVERHPQEVGSAIVKTLIVQGVEHSVSPTWWATRLYLSPAIDSATDAPYLIMGDATYGQIGAAAGNQIPF